ncbi:MAG TPA: rod shape-determining protein RodA, partial [Desulfuromonadaceae bacterium]|nr:rod shape-determining protein RodA [Desulfuromonadaceae bacterium]
IYRSSMFDVFAVKMIDPSINERGDRLDKLQLLAILGLMIVGTAFVFSATAAHQAGLVPWYNQTWMRQIVWFIIGGGAATVICLVDYHLLARWSYVIYWLTICCLVAVLIPHIGTTHWGARRWIDLPFFQLQPSEFAKLSFILALANFLSRPVEELKSVTIFWKGIGMMLLPFLLIMKEPDLGSALVLVPTGLAMMLVAGTPKRFLTKLVGGVSILVVLCLLDVLFAPRSLQIPLHEYQRQRLLVYFGVDFASSAATPQQKAEARQLQAKSSYQGKQALISVGSGGITGKGWRNGDQARLGFLPAVAAHNDFIFSVIAEEEGFVGSLVVLTLYAVVLFTGLRIAGQARDRLGKLVAAGVVTLIFSHVFVNIGMNIRIVPVTGIPLPLLSYGGSSVLSSLIALGLMQNVHIHRRG